MVTLYCDESHDETTYALAGWIASPHGWDGFRHCWQEMLEKHHAPVFHAVEIVERDSISDSRFKGWSFAQEVAIFKDAIDVLLDERECIGWLTSIGCSVSMQPTPEPWIKDKDSIWYLLFCRLFALLLERFPVQNGISIVFDDKPEVRALVRSYYSKAKNLVDRAQPGRLEAAEVAFASDEQTLPLQAADLFAYEWRKRSSDKVLRPGKQPRKSYLRLRERPAELKHYSHADVLAIQERAATGESFVQLMWEYPTNDD